MSKRFRRVPVAIWAICIAILVAQTNAHAERYQPAEPTCETVCWFAPAECPTEADLRARIAEHQAPNPDGTKPSTLPALGLTARVTRTESSYELVLERSGQTRVIRSADCQALAEATAMVVMLSRGDHSGSPDAMTTAPPEVAPAASGPADSATSASAASALLAAPPAVEPPATDVAQPTSATPTTPPRAARPEAPVTQAPAQKPDTAWTLAPSLAGGGLLDAWLLPAVGLGVRIDGGLRFGPGLGVHLVGSWIPTITVPIEGTQVQVEYSYSALGAQLCSALPELPWLATCAALEFAAIEAFASSLHDAKRRTVLTPSPGLGAHWLPEMGSLLIDLGVEAWFPLRNDIFTVNSEGRALHKIPAATARLSLLVGYKF